MECNITQGLLNNFFFVKKPLMPSFVKCWKKHSLAQKKLITILQVKKKKSYD